jgi:hypothetical protein
MRERLTTLGCALGALLLFASLFLRGEQIEHQHATPPTSVERGANGLRGALSWLTGEGIRTASLRERFDSLAARGDLPAAGNLLIVTTPVVTPLRPSEVSALNRWVGSGNTLLVLAALSDRPDWALAGSARADLNLLTGLEVVSRAPPAYRAGVRPGAARSARRRGVLGLLPLAEPLRSTLVANRTHPYLSGVSAAVALSDYPPEAWEVKIPRSGFVLSLAHQRELGEGVLWLRPVGAGRVLVSAFGSLFTNRALGLADNARLLANIVSASLAPGGVVLFDDEHQGLAAAYDPAKFYRDRRLYATLGVVTAVWLAWVLGATRLRLPASRTPAPREAELVRATGIFLARVLRPAAAARRMFELFFLRLRPRARRTAPEEGLPWQWLEQHPRLRLADVRQLRAWYADAYADRRVPLTRLHNLLTRTERQLAV